MKKKQGVLVLILTVVLIGLLAFTTAVGFGPTGTGSAKNIKTGLDLSGGVSITYQAKGDAAEPPPGIHLRLSPDHIA